jgi:hypothetical protein
MGQLVIGAWLMKRMGGMGAFRRTGGQAGGAFGGGFARGAEQGGPGGRGKRGGLIATLGSSWGAQLGVLIGVAAAPHIWKAIADAAGQGPKSPFGHEARRAQKQGTISYLASTFGIGPGVERAGDPRPGHGDVQMLSPTRRRGLERDFARDPSAALRARDFARQHRDDKVAAADAKVAVEWIHRHRDAVLKLNTAQTRGHQVTLGTIRAEHDEAKTHHDLGLRVIDLRDKLSHLRKGTQDYKDTSRELRREQNRLPGTIDKLRGDVSDLRDRLSHLRKGTQAYHDTAEVLRRKQRQLNDAIGAAQGASGHASKGFKGMGRNAFGLAGSVDNAASTIRDAANRILGQLGAKQLHYHSVFGAHGAFSNKVRRGGYLFGGGGLVPIMAAGGELLVDGNQAAVIPGDPRRDATPLLAPAGSAVLTFDGQARMAAGQPLDRAVAMQRPHFRSGGRVGSLGAMESTANAIDRKHYPYVWGGGHGSFSGPYDCSGAVSAVLHAGGLLDRPMVSGDLANWGLPGPGTVTIFANPSHTYMRIAGRYFGTSGANPGGGAGWFPGGPRPGFAVRHAPVTDQFLRRLMWHGPAGALRDIGQGTSDREVKGANRYISRKFADQGAFGGGDLGDGIQVGASWFSGVEGAGGSLIAQSPLPFAELSDPPGSMNWSALGHAFGMKGEVPMGSRWVIGYGGRRKLAQKKDRGAGGAKVNGRVRAVDLHDDLKRALGFPDVGVVSIARQKRRGGFVGAQRFQSGGKVPRFVPLYRAGGTVGERYRRPHGPVHDPTYRGRVDETIGTNWEAVFQQIDAQIALAALTPSTADDQAALRRRISQDRIALGQAIKHHRYADIATYAGALKSDRDSLAELTTAVSENTDAQNSLADELATYNKNFHSVEGIVQSEGLRAFADVIGGQMGGRIQSRRNVAGIGMVARA